MIDYQLTNPTNEMVLTSPLDIEYDSNGQTKVVDDVKVLDQNIVKALLTSLGSNELRPLYGGSFSSLIGAKLDRATSAIFMASEVERVVNRIARFTQSNLKLGPDQRILAVQDVLIEKVDNDPRKIAITILIRTESGASRSLQVPIIQF